ncbi:MAG: hypothetical protein ACYCP0_10505 [Acidiferrobacteraceae bacterium]
MTKMNNRTVVTLLGIIVLLAMPSAQARPVGVTVGVGTMGFGLDVGTPLIQNTLNLRLGFTRFGLSRSGTYSKSGTNIPYHGNFTLESIPVLVDYFPFHGVFHLTARIIDNRTSLSADATPPPGSTVTINGSSYTAAQVGSLTGNADYRRKIEPYLGLGWGNLASASRGFTFGVDLGVLFTGNPQVVLNASNPSNNAQLASDVASAQATAQNNADKVSFWPLIQAGIGYTF